MLVKILQLKSTTPVSLLSEISKLFEELVNNRIVDHPERYVPRMSRSTVSFLAELDSGVLSL